MPFFRRRCAASGQPLPASFACAAWLRAPIMAACAVIAAPASAIGPAPATPTSHPLLFSIPAGPLAQVVAQYAHAAGVALSFDATPLAGLRSPGLQGRYGVDAGFSLLLDGTGLQAIRTAGGAYTLRPLQSVSPSAGTAGAATLSTVTVTAPAPHMPTATEHSASYSASAVTLFQGTQAVRSIPQPVTVITRQLIDDRAMADLHDVLQKTPGIAVDYIDSERVTYWSRGHQIDALLVDGLAVRQNASASVFIQPDTAVLDRVEILRGAAGVLRGSGQPSATVNMVRKRPTPEFQTSADLRLGSWNRHRLQADIAGPVNEAGSVRSRFIAVADEKDMFQTARSEDRKVLYGVLEVDLGPRTMATASLQHTQLQATGAWGGLPSSLDGSPLHLPRSTYLGTDWNRWNRHNQQALAELEHRFDNGWNTRLSAAHTRFRSDGFKQTSFSSASATDPYLVNINTAIYGAEASDQNAAAFTANGPFEWLGRKHQLVVGADAVQVRTTGTSGYSSIAPLTNVDLRNWNPYTSYPEPGHTPGTGIAYTGPDSRTREEGLYSTARLSVSDPLTVVLGGRLSWWNYEAPAQRDSDYRVRREFTPYAGLVYELSEPLSAYASYSEIFSPQNYKDANGQLIAPVRGKDFEAGLKGDLWERRLNASLSVFRIHQVGKAVLDTRTPAPCLPYYAGSHCYAPGGKTRSEGIEVELAGELRPRWQALAGYTYTRTRVLRDDTAATIDEPLRSIDPHHALRLFTSYRLGGAPQGWTVGGGARIQSGSYVTIGSVTSRQGGYALLDAMVGYRFNKNTMVQLNVNNLFDKVYFSKFSPNSTYFNNYYGDPRNVLLTLRAQF